MICGCDPPRKVPPWVFSVLGLMTRAQGQGCPSSLRESGTDRAWAGARVRVWLPQWPVEPVTQAEAEEETRACTYLLPRPWECWSPATMSTGSLTWPSTLPGRPAETIQRQNKSSKKLHLARDRSALPEFQ